MNDDELKKLYCSVFAADGSIKPCGRNTCSKLITEVKYRTGLDVGDEMTGIMNVKIMKDACRGLFT